MRPGDIRDGTRDGLMRLTPLTPDPVHAETVRLRCHLELARRVRRAERTDAMVALVRMFMPVLLGTLSAAYAVALISATLHIEAWLR